MKQVKMPFDGKVIETVTGEDGKPWISVRSVCQAIGIDEKTQRRKIETDTRLTWGHMTSHDTMGRSQEMFCIPLEQLKPSRRKVHVRCYHRA